MAVNIWWDWQLAQSIYRWNRYAIPGQFHIPWKVLWDWSLPQFCYAYKPLEWGVIMHTNTAFPFYVHFCPNMQSIRNASVASLNCPKKPEQKWVLGTYGTEAACIWPLVEAAHRDIFHQFHLLIDGKGHLDAQPFASWMTYCDIALDIRGHCTCHLPLGLTFFWDLRNR